MKTNQELENRLKESIDHVFYSRSYSGRGMYGKRCLGFEIDSNNVAGAVALVISRFVRLRKTNNVMKDISELANIFDHSEQDSMGMGTILYFPQIEWIWDEEQEEK